MPPKRSSSSAKKGTESNPTELYNTDAELSVQIVAFSVRLDALKAEYIGRMESVAEERKNCTLLQQKLSQKLNMVKEKQEERIDILTDFSRQYKTEEGNAIAKIALLDATVNRLQEENKKLVEELQLKENYYDKQLKASRQKLDGLYEKAEEMEREFSAMLNDVEHSMKQ